MKRNINLLVGLWLAAGTVLGCSDALEIGNEAICPEGQKTVMTRADATTMVYQQNPLYVNGAQLPAGTIPAAVTQLNLTINVPADGTYTGVSLRSISEMPLCGTFEVGSNGAILNAGETESIVFAEFPQADGTRFYDLKKGDSFTFNLMLPPATYGANDLVVRLHATGTKLYEAVISTSLEAGKATVVTVTPSAIDGNNWISALPDDALVSQLSIPGTHDAATGDGTTFSLGKTQSLTMQEQWNMGIRMFDLRPGYKKVRSGWFKYVNKLHIYHGIVETKTSFEDAINILCTNLAKNPDEFAIIVMRFENDHFLYNNRDTWNSLMSSFLSSSSFPAERRVDFRPDLTVGELRGKILVLSRDAYASAPSTGAFISGWSHGETGSTSGVIAGKNGSATLHIQDYYSVDNEAQKLASVKDFADKSASASAGVWTINHTSGYTGSIGSDIGYKDNAANNNPELYRYLTGTEKTAGPAGIIVMDHVGSRTSGSYTTYGDLLPQAIIDNNYKFRMARKGE